MSVGSFLQAVKSVEDVASKGERSLQGTIRDIKTSMKVCSLAAASQKLLKVALVLCFKRFLPDNKVIY